MAFQSDEKIYTTAEAARYLGLAEDTVRKLVQRDLLTPATNIGVSHVFQESELARYGMSRRPRGNPNFKKRPKGKRS